MKIIGEKRTISKELFDEKEFYRALLIAIDGDMPIHTYTSELSKEKLNYNRYFAKDYDAVAAIIRGTVSEEKFVPYRERLSNEYREKIASLITLKKNPKNRVVKAFKPELIFSVDDFIRAFNRFESFGGKEGAYSSFDLEKSKKLLDYDRAFSGDYAGFVSAINGTQKDTIYCKLLNQPEVAQAFINCGFFDRSRSLNDFDGERFALATERAFEMFGSRAFNARKFSDEKTSEELLDYNRTYVRDFLIVQKILTGFTSKSAEMYYPELTAEVETKVYKIARLINHDINEPFNMRKFIEFTRKNMGKSFSAMCASAWRYPKDRYSRDYAIDYMIVQNAIEGFRAPAFVLDALTPQVRKELYSIGFGEAVPFNLDDFIRTCNMFNEYSEFKKNLKEFDKATSFEALDYSRSFARDCAYMNEIIDGKNPVSEVVAQYNTDKVRALLITANVPKLTQAKKIDEGAERN